MDIQDEIDRSFGAGPEPGPVEALVADGRRALRRRRASTGAAALAIVLIAGAPTWPRPGRALRPRGGGSRRSSPTRRRPERGPVPPGPGDPVARDVEQGRDAGAPGRRDAPPQGRQPDGARAGEVRGPGPRRHGQAGLDAHRVGPRGRVQRHRRRPRARDDVRPLAGAVVRREPAGASTSPAEQEPAAYTGDGRLVLRDGVTILRRVEQPAGPPARREVRGPRPRRPGQEDLDAARVGPGRRVQRRVEAGRAHRPSTLARGPGRRYQRPGALPLVAFGEGESWWRPTWTRRR